MSNLELIIYENCLHSDSERNTLGWLHLSISVNWCSYFSCMKVNSMGLHVCTSLWLYELWTSINWQFSKVLKFKAGLFLKNFSSTDVNIDFFRFIRFVRSRKYFIHNSRFFLYPNSIIVNCSIFLSDPSKSERFIKAR